MFKVLEYFEPILIKILIVMMAVVLVFSTIELGSIIVEDVAAPPFLQITLKGVLEVFDLFMVILIGLELLESIKAYLDQQTFRIEVILVVAMIAIARKIIVLDIKKVETLTIFGIAAVVLALAVSYYLISRSRVTKNHPDDTH